MKPQLMTNLSDDTVLIGDEAVESTARSAGDIASADVAVTDSVRAESHDAASGSADDDEAAFD